MPRLNLPDGAYFSAKRSGKFVRVDTEDVTGSWSLHHLIERDAIRMRDTLDKAIAQLRSARRRARRR